MRASLAHALLHVPETSSWHTIVDHTVSVRLLSLDNTLMAKV